MATASDLPSDDLMEPGMTSVGTAAAPVAGASFDKPCAPLCARCDERGRELRRGLCALCYDQWLRARPVGVGAFCSACGDRRRPHLRFVELPGRWLVLCHNCTAHGDSLRPCPETAEELLRRLRRDRREERAGAPLPSPPFAEVERRMSERGREDHELETFLSGEAPDDPEKTPPPPA